MLKNRLIYKQKFHRAPEVDTFQLLLPKPLRKEVMRLLHNNISARQFGVTRTLTRIKERFNWPSLREDVAAWCRSCLEYQKAKKDTRKPKRKLQVSRVGVPVERVGIDIFGPLIQTVQGNRYVLVISDYFTRWTEVYEMKNIDAITVTDILVKEYICRFGIPRQIHTEKGNSLSLKYFGKCVYYLTLTKQNNSISSSEQWLS